MGGTTGLEPDNSVDCNNDCNGLAVIDDCGTCTGGKTGLEFNVFMDCNNTCNGTAKLDQCDVCYGGDTGIISHLIIGVEPGETMDCEGICDGELTEPCVPILEFDTDEYQLNIISDDIYFLYAEYESRNEGNLTIFLDKFQTNNKYISPFELNFFVVFNGTEYTNMSKLEIAPGNTFTIKVEIGISSLFIDRYFIVLPTIAFFLVYKIGNSMVFNNTLLLNLKSVCKRDYGIFKCNNLPGCFYCFKLNEYNSYSMVEGESGFCIEGNQSKCKPDGSCILSYIIFILCILICIFFVV